MLVRRDTDGQPLKGLLTLDAGNYVIESRAAVDGGSTRFRGNRTAFLRVVITPVPEPASAGLLLGLGCVMLRRRG